jgi:hypothetical protein
MDGARSSGVFTVEDLEGDARSGGGQVARWVEVEVLGQSRGLAAIRGELEPGDPVLTLGHIELRDGAPIRVVQREGPGRDSEAGVAAETSR